MERSITWIGAQVVATTMIVVGALLAHAGELVGSVMALIGMGLVLDLTGVFQPAGAEARVRLIGARGHTRGMHAKRTRAA